MKVLTVRDPWAQMIVVGHKDVENRSWRTSYRGPLAIHLGAGGPSGEFRRGVAKGLVQRSGREWDERDLNFPAGHIIGIVDLVDIVRGHPSPWAEKGDHLCHWVLENPRVISPIAVKGKQGLWEHDV